jgi:D-proline reductase (dithiol) PrdB
VGLVARVIEAAGIPTVTLELVWPFQRVVGIPRIAAVEHPFARPFGDAGDAATQRAVLLAALGVLGTAREPGHIEHLPIVWPPDPEERRSWHPAVPSPVAALMLERRRREAAAAAGGDPAAES